MVSLAVARRPPDQKLVPASPSLPPYLHPQRTPERVRTQSPLLKENGGAAVKSRLQVLPRPKLSTARLSPAPNSAPDSEWLRRTTDPVRLFGFKCALIFVFLRVSSLHEIIASALGTNPYLAVVFGAPALLAVLISGGIQRAFAFRAAKYWCAFAVWLCVTSIFSFWKAGSLAILAGYFKSEFPVLFMIGGLVVTWKELRQMFGAIGLAAVINEYSGRQFSSSTTDNGRLYLQFGSFANSNDFAAHMLWVVPFIVLMMLISRWKLVKIAGGIMLPVALFLIARCASRGAMVALGLGLLFILVMAPPSVRLVGIVAAPLACMVGLATLPHGVIGRYTTWFDKSAVDAEAVGSSEQRTYLLKTSVAMTLQHPIFGVGPGEFTDVEGANARANNQHGAWAVTHNSYTEISSETGFPGIALYLAAIGSTFLLAKSLYRRKDVIREVHQAAFCILVSLVLFGSAIVFLALAYHFYLPALTGLSIALASVVRHDPSLSQPIPASQAF